jgi:hypothetical protein
MNKTKTRLLLYGAYGYTGIPVVWLQNLRQQENSMLLSQAATKTRWQKWAIG